MDELEFLIDLARQAGRIAGDIRDTGFTVIDKGGGLGPVTEADRAASDFLMAGLSRKFPDDLVVSEEADPPRSTGAPRVWYVDPIDGTKEFIRGGNDWTVMVGAAENGVSVIGVVHRPLTGETYFARKGSGAWLRNHASPDSPDLVLKTRNIDQAAQAVMICSKSHRSRRVQEAGDSLGISKTFEMGSVGLKLSKVAQGEADLYFNFSGMPNLWDLCAADVILAEAGGELLRLDPQDWGSPVPYSLEQLQVGVPFFGATAGLRETVLTKLKDLENT